MKSLTLLIAFLNAPSSFSSAYERFDELKPSQKLALKSQYLATTPLHIGGGLRCTAVFIGPNGEALTNLHCLESCLQNTGKLAQEKIAGSDLFLNKPQNGAFCEVSFQKNAGEKLSHSKAEILQILGPGWISPREKLADFANANNELFLFLLNEGYEAAGDLALIRLPRSGPCIQIGEEDFSKNISANNLAFPILMRKKDDNPMSPIFFTMGTSLLFSHGMITKNQSLYKQTTGIDYSEDQMQALFPRDILMSSIDAETGSSGSPIFSEKGELVAITRSTFKEDNPNYSPWATQAIDLAGKKNLIQALVPKNASCQITSNQERPKEFL